MIFASSRLLAFVAMLLAISQGVLAEEAIGISNYNPSQFIESAESPFFYSIGKRLKYGSSIDESAPVLFEGSWPNGDIEVYPSPDNQKAAIVSNRKLYIAEVGRPPLLALENVDHYDPKRMSEGDVYFKWPTLQWHPNSRFIYIAKDKKQKIWGQTFSKDAILVRVDIEDIGAIKESIFDFRSNSYFFVGPDSVCFNYAPGDGSVIWKCSTAKGISRARSLDSTGIHLDNGVVLNERRFLSYMRNIYESAIWMARYGFSVRQINERQDGLFHKDASNIPLLTFNTARNIKGHRVNGIHQSGGLVLPGGRYLLLNMVGGSSEGQILLDRLSGHYRKLPKDTRVYRNLNSTQYEDFVFSIDNRPGNSFMPDARVLP
jgi:hypothetical protein